MKPPPTEEKKNQASQLGATDQIEQRAAALAVKDGHTSISNDDREEALEQMQETSPPPAPGPAH